MEQEPVVGDFVFMQYPNGVFAQKTIVSMGYVSNCDYGDFEVICIIQNLEAEGFVPHVLDMAFTNETDI